MAPQHPLVDKPAPSFSIPDSNGETFKFPPEQGGRPTALFFYPESGTYGCTREACQFRDALAEQETYKRCDVQVVGVSSDPVEKQKAFVDKHKLPYPVLSDTNHEAHNAYQVGRGMLGLTDARTTFVINSKGIVRGVLNATMNHNAHVKFVARELEKMQAPGATDAERDAPFESAETGEGAQVAQAS